jgi:ELWxxDGT repeat protein
MKNSFPVFVAIYCLHAGSYAQELVKDINTAPASLVDILNDATERCIPCGGLVYFHAKDSLGNELWRTDGTAAGTKRVIDQNPGPGDGLFPNEPALCFNGLAYFRDRSSSRLFKTDGTEAGTTAVTDNMVGPYGMQIFNNRIYYITNDREMWSTSGVRESETRLITIDYGPNVRVNLFAYASAMTRMYFTINLWDDSGLQGSELWKTDGTFAGTALLKSFPYENFFTTGLITHGDQVYFLGKDEDHGAELWKSDGTPEGTTMVTDLHAGTAESGIYLRTIYDGKLIFSMDNNTWVSDGTDAGTKVLIPSVYCYGYREFNNALYILGGEHLSWNTLLVKTDGTPEGTVKLDTIGYSMLFLETLPVANNKLLFPFLDVDKGIEIGVSNGVANNSKLLKDINPGEAESLPRFYAELDNEVIFMANDGIHGFELWKTDGTAGGTNLLMDVESGTESANLESIHMLNGKLLFLAGENANSQDLWVSDGTEAGTQMVHEFISPNVFGKTDDHIVILDNWKFWKSDGTPEGTVVMWDYTSLFSSTGYNSNPAISAGPNLYFQLRMNGAPIDIWRANTVTNEVSRVVNTDPGIQLSFTLFKGAPLGNELVFAATDDTHGEEIWVTIENGSKKKLLKDINPGSDASELCCIAAAGDKVFFGAKDNVHGLELWLTDGTADGTVMVKDIAAGPDWGLPGMSPAVLGDKLIFPAYDPQGTEPWISDGTAAGTQLLRNIHSENSGATNFVTLGDKVYFSAIDNTAGRELFVTDGTPEGTRLIDLVPGIQGSDPVKMTRSGDAVYIYSNKKLWRTLGTSGTSELVAGVEIFSDLYAVGNYICFEARDVQFGRELLRVEVTKFNQTITFPPIGNKISGGPSFEVNALSSSGLPVTLTSDSENISITGNQVQILGPGEATIVARQEGDGNIKATSVSATFCINPPKPEISVSYGDDEAILTSSASEDFEWFRNGELFNSSEEEVTVSDDAMYTLRVSTGGCSSEFSQAVLIVTGIEDVKRNFHAYPNPAVDVIHAAVPLIERGTRFTIMDLTGKVIVDRMSRRAEESFDLAHIRKGIYVMHVMSGNTSVYKRFLKQ